MKSSFIIHLDSLDVIDDLSDEQCGELLRAMKAYHLKDDFTPSAIVKVAFSPFKNQFIRDLKKYESIVERNRINGLKGGRPLKENKPTGLLGNPDEPKKADSVNGSGSKSKSDSDSGNDSDSKKEEIKPKPVPAKKKQEIIVIEYPDGLNKEAWLTWIDHRREAKIKKLTPRGENIAIKQLIAMGNHAEQLLIIEQSMGCSYTGLFPLKKQNGKQSEGKRDIMAEIYGNQEEKLIN